MQCKVLRFFLAILGREILVESLHSTWKVKIYVIQQGFDYFNCQPPALIEFTCSCTPVPTTMDVSSAGTIQDQATRERHQTAWQVFGFVLRSYP